MSKLTLEMECWGHKELKEYLLGLSGVQDVEIDETLNLLLDITYNSKLISAKTLKMEIFAFLDATKIPSLIYFDKHPKGKVNKYSLVIENLCCEYCLKGVIEDLIMIDGIEKADSNIDDVPYRTNDAAKIDIHYDPKVISKEELIKIEKELNNGNK